MASSPAPGPSTPDNTARRLSTNRSVTHSPRLSTSAKDGSAEIGSTKDVETLFFHPSASVIKLVISSSTRPSAGGLPWASPTERTMAVGQVTIYRVPGSASFLHSGHLLHAILPRSQCWCVDGVSKFAMRVLPDTYYRIDLPGETEEDMEKVEQLKLTLQKVLFYERTACPFARTFDADLPEMPDIRKRKGRKAGPSKKWKLDRAFSWKPEDGGEPPLSESGSSGGSDEELERPVAIDPEELADEVREVLVSTPTRTRPTEALRSVTAPPQVMADLATSPVPTGINVDGVVGAIESAEADARTRAEAQNRSPQQSRVWTYQTIPTDMPPSPPDSSAGLDYLESRGRVEARNIEEHSTPLQAHDAAVGSEKDTKALDTVTPSTAALDATTRETRSLESAAEAVGDERPTFEIDDSQPQDTHEEIVFDINGTQRDPEELAGPYSGVEDQQPSRTPLSKPKPTTADLFPIVEDVSEAQTPSFEASVPSNDLLSAAETDLEPQMVLLEAKSTANTNIPVAEHAQDFETLPNGAELITTDAPDTLEDKRMIQPSQGEAETSALDLPPTHQNIAHEDPYAAIQARIQARRSIGGTTTFHPAASSLTRSSTASSNRSILSARSHSSQQQQALASALVNKAYATFLGPPARLVNIMLRIAARLAGGAFGVDSLFYVESPLGQSKKVPGSFNLDGGIDSSDEEWLEGDDDLDDEDDFGVPLRSPVRLAQGRTGIEVTGLEGLRARASREVE